MSDSKIVHVVGTGTIGEPLIGLLAAYRDLFAIDEVTFHKRTPAPVDRAKLAALEARGAKLAVDRENWSAFEKIGVHPALEAGEAIERARVVIDCTPAGNQNKVETYQRFSANGQRFIAQGSEFGFGKMYAFGINDEALDREADRFLQVVSCNTHNLAVLIDALAIGPEKEDNLEDARFVCMRRANDVSQEGGFIPAPEIGEHEDPQFGTHQARDAHALFHTLGFDLNLYSSAAKINTQYMHTIHFSLKLRRKVDIAEIFKRLNTNTQVALTQKKSSAAVFSFGRDHGLFGRIFNQTVVVEQSLAVRNEREVVGLCFTPQDGNSLVSSIAAALWFMYPDSYRELLHPLKPYFFDII